MTQHAAVGSWWQKWDLHVHTPASYEWRGTPRLRNLATDQRAGVLRSILSRWADLKFGVYAVVDYWTFDGYFALKDLIQQERIDFKPLLLPGIELRIHSAGEERLNIQVLFHEDTERHKLTSFIERLRMAPRDGVAPTWENVRDAARRLSPEVIRRHGMRPESLTDDDSAATLGYMTVTITQDSFIEALQPFRDPKTSFVVLPYDTADSLSDLVSWEHHPGEHRWFLDQADALETRSQRSVDTLLGRRTEGNAHFIDQAYEQHGQRPRLAICGSDAHSIDAYGAFPGDKYCWIKAEKAFAGLLQAKADPEERAFIGLVPPKVAHVKEHATKYIKGIEIRKLADSTLPEHWFNTRLALNPGLVAIIGNRGSGKTALADVLALLGNTRDPTRFEFLSDTRFRQPPENKAAHFQGTIHWLDGDTYSRALAEATPAELPERVKYLPQAYIERLCDLLTAGRGSDLERELSDVVFSHIGSADRLGAPTMEDLLRLKSVDPVQQLELRRRELASLNREVLRLQLVLSPTSVAQMDAALVEARRTVEAHEATRPEPVPPPNPQADTAREAANRRLQELRDLLSILERDVADREREHADALKLLNTLDRAESRIRALGQEVERVRSALAADLVSLGLSPDDLFRFSSDSEALARRRAQLVLSRDGALAALDATDGLRVRHAQATAELTQLQSTLDEPGQRFEAYLQRQREWEQRLVELQGASDRPNTLRFFESRIAARSELLVELQAVVTRRRELAIEVFRQVERLREVRAELFSPIVRFIDERAPIAREFGLEFRAGVSCVDFEEPFLQYIAQNRRGAFYGRDDARRAVRELVAAANFGTLDGALAFIDSVLGALEYDPGNPATLDRLLEQVRDRKQIPDLLDFLFSMPYVRPNFSMTLRGKEIGLLSPGERGALLIVFYLLLDPSDIPLIIDQPEHNLDNETVFRYLVPCFKDARKHRQVVVVTHNPNLAVVADAEQVIVSHFDKADGSRITYESGALENPTIAQRVVDVLEGTMPAFRNRDERYRTAGLADEPVEYPRPIPRV